MLNATVPVPCCPPCGGHCNRHAQMCMQRLGRQGPHCNLLSAVAAGDESYRLLPNQPRPRNRDGQLCLSTVHTVGRLRSYAGRWANATASGRTHSCFNNCSGGGACVNAWCECERSRFGIDCAHHSIGNAHPTQSRLSVAIYVYEPPPDLSFSFGRAITKIYQAERAFLARLLPDWSVRTLVPDEADLFLVPWLSAYSPAENSMCDAARLAMLYRWLDKRHTWLWRRRGGRDHVIWLTGDRGACGLGPLGANPIFVSHWGLLGPWQQLDRRNFSSPAHAATLRAGQWCFNPSKDVVCVVLQGTHRALQMAAHQCTPAATLDANHL